MAPEQDERVGVRELRQNLSVYLRRVRRGESLVVTEHGRPVARLAPLASAVGMLDRLIEQRRATAASGSLADLPPLEGLITDEASRELAELREDRI